MLLPKQETITFGATKATELTLSDTEQFSNEIGIGHYHQHDLRVPYTPGVTNDADVYLQTTIYVSSRGLGETTDTEEWSTLIDDVDDGNGNKFPTKKIFHSPAHSDEASVRSPNRYFYVGGKKIRFGFKEVGSPATPGTIDFVTLNSRQANA